MTRRQRLIIWMVLAALILPVPVIAAVTTGPVGGLIAAVPLLGAVLLGWGSSRSRRIVVTPHEIAALGLIVRRRGQRARAARLVRARLIPLRGLPYETVFVLDATGRIVIRIYGNGYAHTDIDRLVAFLRLPWNGPGEPVTANQLSTMYPGLIRWHEAHPFLFALALVAGVLLTIVIAGAVTLMLRFPDLL